MTPSPDKLLSIARESGATESFGNGLDKDWEDHYTFSESALSTYTARIRAEVLEEAALVCDRLGVSEYPRDCDDCAAAIRSIGTTDGGSHE
jgi:hypothetical protein